MVINIQDQSRSERPFNLFAWGHWFTFANLLLALIISFFYFGSEQPPQTFVGWLYLLLTWIGHFAFLSLSCFLLSIFPVITIFPYKKHIRGVSALLASVFQFYLFLDVLAYRGLGYHLSGTSLNQLREVEDVYTAQLGNGYWLMLLGIIVTILTFEFVASNFTWKKLNRLQAFKYKNVLATSLICSFLASHLFHIWADATLNADIAKQNSLFPASYPLTAKSLLAKYELIDLQQYQESKSRQTNFMASQFQIKPAVNIACTAEQIVALDVYLIDSNNKKNVVNWLNDNNIRYQLSNQLVLANDVETSLFNFSTGLPGLYQHTEQIEQYNINQQFDKKPINVTLHTGDFAIEDNFVYGNSKRVFVFYDNQAEQPFYRAQVILIGFPKLFDVPFSPQNIIASYLSDGLNCAEYVNTNLIDEPLTNLLGDHILTNFYNGYFHLVYKDKAMLFHSGKLLSNTSFSTSQSVDEVLDVYTVQKGIQKITEKRIKQP